MFPIPFNFPFRKKNGDVTTIGDAISSGGSSHDLPIASSDTLGGVKIGDGITIDESGKISVSGGGLDMKIKTVSIPQTSSSSHTHYVDFTPDEGYTPIGISYEYSGGSPNSPYTITSLNKRTYLSEYVWTIIFLCYEANINVSGTVNILEVKT